MAVPAAVGLLVAADAVDAAACAGARLVAVAALLSSPASSRRCAISASGARRPSAARSGRTTSSSLLVPLLVVANGLTPYLEVKTAYGWNMYANLRTVDGDSNHFVVRSTLPLTDEQADLVRIISTDDPGLTLYAEGGYALTWTQLRIYLSDLPACGSPTRGATDRGVVQRVGAAGAGRAGARLAGEAAALPGRRPRVAGALRAALRPRTLTGPVRDPR